MLFLNRDILALRIDFDFGQRKNLLSPGSSTRTYLAADWLRMSARWCNQVERHFGEHEVSAGRLGRLRHRKVRVRDGLDLECMQWLSLQELLNFIEPNSIEIESTLAWVATLMASLLSPKGARGLSNLRCSSRDSRNLAGPIAVAVVAKRCRSGFLTRRFVALRSKRDRVGAILREVARSRVAKSLFEQLFLGIDIVARALVHAIGIFALIEDCEHAEIVGLGNGIVFMVMALCAGHRHPHPNRHGGVDSIDDRHVSKLFVVGSTFVVGQGVSMMKGSSDHWSMVGLGKRSPASCSMVN